mmetsp:Transcript_2865/g.8747  ORF Transcript_2865/g.8747 Transcript_2865/m.8747 type:complete len:198 (+) Transcript_2865:138-731(+)
MRDDANPDVMQSCLQRLMTGDSKRSGSEHRTSMGRKPSKSTFVPSRRWGLKSTLLKTQKVAFLIDLIEPDDDLCETAIEEGRDSDDDGSDDGNARDRLAERLDALERLPSLMKLRNAANLRASAASIPRKLATGADACAALVRKRSSCLIDNTHEIEYAISSGSEVKSKTPQDALRWITTRMKLGRRFLKFGPHTIT